MSEKLYKFSPELVYEAWTENLFETMVYDISQNQTKRFKWMLKKRSKYRIVDQQLVMANANVIEGIADAIMDEYVKDDYQLPGLNETQDVIEVEFLNVKRVAPKCYCYRSLVEKKDDLLILEYKQRKKNILDAMVVVSIDV